MSDKLTRDETVRRADQARDINEDPALKAAWNAVRESLIDEWIGTQPEEVEKRETIWRQLQVIEGVQRKIAKFIVDGKAIEHGL